MPARLGDDGARAWMFAGLIDAGTGLQHGIPRVWPQLEQGAQRARGCRLRTQFQQLAK